MCQLLKILVRVLSNNYNRYLIQLQKSITNKDQLLKPGIFLA